VIGNVPRDARPVPAPAAGTPRFDPRSHRIWIRIGGTWYAGDIQRWFRQSDGDWGC